MLLTHPGQIRNRLARTGGNAVEVPLSDSRPIRRRSAASYSEISSLDVFVSENAKLDRKASVVEIPSRSLRSIPLNRHFSPPSCIEFVAGVAARKRKGNYGQNARLESIRLTAFSENDNQATAGRLQPLRKSPTGNDPPAIFAGHPLADAGELSVGAVRLIKATCAQMEIASLIVGDRARLDRWLR